MAVALHSENIQEEDDDDDDDDINYANVETKTTTPQQKHPRKIRSVRRRYRLVGLGLGLLCGVQALLNIGLRLSLYSELIKENNNLVKDLDHLQSRYNNITEQKDQCGLDLDHIQTRYNNITELKVQCGLDLDHLQSRYNKLIERNDIKRILCEPHGFTFGGGVCYYISTWGTTWEKSRQYCRDKQSDLMVINSKEKQDFVNTVVNRNQVGVWLGLTDREEEGVWKWVDGTPLTTPTYWRPGEPDNYGDEDCVMLDDGRWVDRSCSALFYLICERVI